MTTKKKPKILKLIILLSLLMAPVYKMQRTVSPRFYRSRVTSLQFFKIKTTYHSHLHTEFCGESGLWKSSVWINTCMCNFTTVAIFFGVEKRKIWLEQDLNKDMDWPWWVPLWINIPVLYNKSFNIAPLFIRNHQYLYGGQSPNHSSIKPFIISYLEICIEIRSFENF